jgi:hypothetical protein
MRRIVLALAAVLVVACSSSGPEDPVPSGGGGGASSGETELAGRRLETVDEGPWRVRRDPAESEDGRGGPGSPAEARGRREMVEAEGAAPASGAIPAAGDAPPTGAPVTDAGGAARGAAPLRAGETDDNEDFEAFLRFLASWSDRENVAPLYDPLDVRDRRFVRVLDAAGRPVPAATVRIVDEAADAVLWEGTTYGDGRVPYYPLVARPPSGALTSDAGRADRLLVEVRTASASRRTVWDGTGEELLVRLEGDRVLSAPIRLDVLFLLDTTGSMGDEIARIKETLLRVTERLRELGREFDLRYGAVLYRDLGDEYVTKTHAFTGDVEAFAEALKQVVAAGGGDGPESLNQGLKEAVALDWRPDAAKVAFLVADAPPHMDYEGDVPYGRSLRAAVARGIRIHAVAASGLDELGSVVFRQVAQFTRGRFVFIEYGGTRESADAHGVAGSVRSNNLDEILFTRIREEVARWGREDGPR